MPGIKELDHFREELSKLGNEREVTEERGETYEPLPPPSAAINTEPSIDVDNLLAGLDGDESASGQQNTPQDSAPAEIPDPAASEAPPVSAGDGSEEVVAEDFAVDRSEFDSILDSLQLDGEDPQPSEADISTDIPGPDDFSLPEFDGIPSREEAVDEPEQPADAVEELTESADEIEELVDDANGAADEPVDPVAALDALLAAGLPELDDQDDNDFSVPEDFEPAIPQEQDSSNSDDFSLDDIPSFDDTDSADSDGFSLPEDFSMPSLEDAPGGFDEDTFDAPVEPATSLEASDTPGFDDIPDLSDIPVMDDLQDSGEVQDMNDSFDLGDIAALDDTPETDEISEPSSDESEPVLTVEEPEPDLSQEFEAMDLTPPSSESPGIGLETTHTPPAHDDFSDFSIPDDLPIPPEEELASGDESAIDGFDGFSLDEDILQGGGGSPEDEFHIPGFSDFAEGTGLDGLDDLIPKETSRRSSKKEIPLEISESDFTRFLDLLARYPLNLRMAVEEYLSEGDGSTHQKMEIVHHILEETPLKKVARIMEDRLNRSIPIPKDFEKKTAAEYEEEKKSLRYIFINKILPAAILFTGISILTFCVLFLSWQFIYRPLAAVSLYKRGYAAIEDARYTQSMKLFDEAVVVWNKKKWYFRYARAYREKKQYISAEVMYERLLNRFKNDKTAGLEYAEMLRTDLRNFEKAETVLKRRVLDNYVNDPAGMMLLGDTYLDWGEEDPAKYAQARAVYASLIELYGRKDPYLARMMRYFIRTDNLTEVLPLKDHFVSKRRMTLDAPDLVELSGYLLDKRYNPAPGDSEALRAQIDDVRSLLEQAVKADPQIPEAHYNIGRFFIHNYKQEQASLALGEALRLFDTATPMYPRRVLTRIDSFRLLGELRSADKEFLRAQALYAQGMELYEQQRENRAVPKDPRVGRLYADSADIDYFISNDLDAALRHYSRAIEELHDTPSVRYRTGYIHYQRRNFEQAMHAFSRSYAEKPEDRNLRFAFANTLFRRGNLYVSQGHYERLMESLEAERIRKGIVFPQARSDHGAFVEQYMKTSNNLGVTLNRIANQTGDSGKNARALSLLSESARAWDAMTRNPETLVRLSRVRMENERALGSLAPGSDVNGNLAYMNIKCMTHPRPEFMAELYADIPKTLEGEAILQQREDR